ADSPNHAGKIPSQDVGKPRLPVRLAGAHLPVGAVDAGGDGVDHHLVWSGRRIGQFAILQDLRSAMLHDEDSFHGACSWGSRRAVVDQVVYHRFRGPESDALEPDREKGLPRTLIRGGHRFSKGSTDRARELGRAATLAREDEADIALGLLEIL